MSNEKKKKSEIESFILFFHFFQSTLIYALASYNIMEIVTHAL